MIHCFGAILSELYGSGSAYRRHSVRPACEMSSLSLSYVDSLKLDARRVHDIVYRDLSVTHLTTCIMRRGSLRL